MNDWEHDATITTDTPKAGQPPAFELTRDDLVLEVGEQAIGRVFAEKRLRQTALAALSLRKALDESKVAAEKGEEYHKSCDLLSGKNATLNEEIEKLRTQVSLLESEIKTSKDQTDVVKTQKASFETQVGQLEKDCNATQERVRQLEGELNDAHSQIKELNKKSRKKTKKK